MRAKTKTVAGQIAERLKQPSTYAGLALLAGAVGWNVDPGAMQDIMKTGMAVGGVVAVLLNEGASK